jgi:hypothetical protein
MGIPILEISWSLSHSDQCKGLILLLYKAGGKRWSKFNENDGTKAFIAELEVGPNLDPPLIDQVLDGPNHLRDTWVCKELAAWISPAFEVQVIRWHNFAHQGLHC